jgi:hypothetical protein
MSVTSRTIWILGSAIALSWLSLRSLAAAPEPVMDDPPLAVVCRQGEVADASLTAVISRFADQARSAHHAAR